MSDQFTPEPGVLLYPERRRCRKCRKYFSVLIVDRQYCSFACAGKTIPSAIPYDHPRSCRTLKPGEVWVTKQTYNAPEEATPTSAQSVYYCATHGGWHVGTHHENRE